MTATDDAILTRLLRQGWAGLREPRIEPVAAGMSDASVYRVHQDGQPLNYLKIAHADAAALLRDEIARTQWLAAHGVPVPALLRIDDSADSVVVLSRALRGLPATTGRRPLPELIDAIAAGLAALHAVPTFDCPFDETLAIRLGRARRAIDAGDVDARHFADRNADVDPNDLIARLIKTQPPQDLVVIHGDATLSNILINDCGGIGFVDCGNAGRGDRYIDLAVTANDIDEHFGSEAVARFAKAYTERSGGHLWDQTKADYYLDLYELF
ncbi:MAG: APH(3') family aminoglycoside O-phosphotransferase [Rhodopseudomonas sp.]|nr:APH(3') family aminoglycoside O-phosphotransferase [Rhodopseudomonas sp.]